jgi:hypothetical protein
MKKILTLSLLFTACFCIQAQEAKIQFSETDHDFGKIPDSDNVTFDFQITNNSDETLLITDVKASCGCTRPIWTKSPIEPGKSGTITAIYNPSGRGYGKFSKTLSVKTNLASTKTLTIRGDVFRSDIRKNIPFADKTYPYSFGKYLLKSNKVDFGNIKLGDKKTITVQVYNNYDENITPKVNKASKQISVVFQKPETEAKSTGKMDITYNSSGTSQYGLQTDNISFLIDGNVYTLPYTVTVLDYTDDAAAVPKNKAGKININFNEINFGNYASGNSRTIKVSNSGKGKLAIRNIQTFDPAVTVSKKQFTLDPDEIGEFKVTIDKSKIKTQLSSNILITCNDPTNQTIEIKLSSAQTK